jgi:SAM-dependent methyltransferase
MKKLNFGCGNNIRKGWENVDIQKGKNITKSFDFGKFPYPLKANDYDYIYIDNVLEHLLDPQAVLAELWKISKKDAIIEIIVPHYSNKGAYSDMEHVHYYNEICFINFAERVLKFDKKKKFEVVELTLVPTKIGAYIPKKIREKLSLFLNGLISQIKIKYKVLK